MNTERKRPHIITRISKPTNDQLTSLLAVMVLAVSPTKQKMTASAPKPIV